MANIGQRWTNTRLAGKFDEWMRYNFSPLLCGIIGECPRIQTFTITFIRNYVHLSNSSSKLHKCKHWPMLAPLSAASFRRSDTKELHFLLLIEGVPQGSVSGRLLFNFH